MKILEIPMRDFSMQKRLKPPTHRCDSIRLIQDTSLEVAIDISRDLRMPQLLVMKYVRPRIPKVCDPLHVPPLGHALANQLH